MKITSLLVLLFLISPVYGQKVATIKTIRKEKEIEKAFAENAIQELKSGVLLVRLNFRQRAVDYYKKHGNIPEAERIEKKQREINKYIVKAFSDYFDFCPVYYFKMSDSQHLVNGELDSVTFYNDLLIVDSLFMPKTDQYLMAEYGNIQQDTSAYLQGTHYDTSKESPKVRTYYGATKNMQHALIVMDRDFQQIQSPFPYFATYRPISLIKNRFGRAVRILHENLEAYYKKVNLKLLSD